MYSINRLIEDFPYTSSPNMHYNKEYIIYGVLEKKKIIYHTIKVDF